MKKLQLLILTSIHLDTHRKRSCDSTLRVAQIELIIQRLPLAMGSVLGQSPGKKSATIEASVMSGNDFRC